jgi:hypothetical protein
LKQILRKRDAAVLTGFVWLNKAVDPVAGSQKHDNEQSVSMKGKFLDHRPVEATVQCHYALFPRVVALLPSSKFPTYQPFRPLQVAVSRSETPAKF